jgi:hypothetical protein
MGCTLCQLMNNRRIAAVEQINAPAVMWTAENKRPARCEQVCAWALSTGLPA